MNVKLRPFVCFFVVCFFFVPRLWAQEDAANDSDLTKMLKEAEDMQKKNPPAAGAKKKLAEMEADAKTEAARQEQEEKRGESKASGRFEKAARGAGHGCVT